MKPGVPASIFRGCRFRCYSSECTRRLQTRVLHVNHGLKDDGVLDYFDDHEQPSQKRGEKTKRDA
jgi:hypothetical protein